MKRWISLRVESIVEDVALKIRKGEVVMDDSKYQLNRAARLQADVAARRRERKEREEQERRRAEMLEAAEKEALEKTLLEEQAIRTKQQRDEQRRLRLQRRQEERDHHKAALEKVKKTLSRVKKDKPLYQKMQERYEKRRTEVRKKETDWLEERKSRPLNIEELRENERKYTEMAELKAREMKKIAQMRIMKREQSNQRKRYYRGNAYRRILDEDTQMRLVRKREKQVKQMIDRKREYGKLIREMFKPAGPKGGRSEIMAKMEQEKERKEWIEKVRAQTVDKNTRGWRIENEDDLAAERRRIRLKKKKEREEEERRKKERSKSAPNYLDYCKKRGRKASRRRPPRPQLEDLGAINRDVEKLERETQQRTRALRKSAEGIDDVEAAEEETDMFIRLAKEKMRLLHRVRQNSR